MKNLENDSVFGNNFCCWVLVPCGNDVSENHDVTIWRVKVAVLKPIIVGALYQLLILYHSRYSFFVSVDVAKTLLNLIFSRGTFC